MRTQKTNNEIRNQNQQILNNISNQTKEIKRNSLRAKGHVLYTEAHAKGFKKIGWDVYQRPVDVDAGRIWSVEEVDGDKWLVCYTDVNDTILRNLTKSAQDFRMSKKAQSLIEPVMGYTLKPGDLAEITPRQAHSFNYKYAGKRGVIGAAMPDRSELRFDDGTSLWIENKDLTPITDSKELHVGDEVRMFAKDISGRITKISRDGEYITFKNNIDQEFTARQDEIIKKALFMVHTDPNVPEDAKAAEKMIKQVYQQQPSPNPFEKPSEQDEMMPDLPEEDIKIPTSGISNMTDPAKIPPAIKQKPSAEELGAGTAMPAADIGGDSLSKYDWGTASWTNASNVDKTQKLGRRMNIGDQVQRKSTGENGIITDVQFDRKLGKFYLIDFGAQAPEQVYDTDLMKLKGQEQPAAMPMPTEITPGPTRLIGASVKTSILDDKYNFIKDAALDFVTGMLDQAVSQHEDIAPNTKISAELEQALAKRAIATFMSKYLPKDLMQTMSYDDKNELSKWLLFETAETKQDAPTTQEFAPVENKPMETQKTEQDLATQKVIQATVAHFDIKKYSPAKFASPIEKNRFIHAATNELRHAGMDQNTAHLIAQSIIATNTVNSPLLSNRLHHSLHYDKKVVPQLIAEAQYVLDGKIFDTTKGQKYALDLPGMEALRGGGGGYPGGVEAEPMGWEINSPKDEEQENPDMLQNALNEQLSDQSKPFEEAAPKLNIELDSENKKIVIDYNQEEEPALPLEGAGVEEELPAGKESPNMPSTPELSSAKPGNSVSQGDNPSTDFADSEIPVNF